MPMRLDGAPVKIGGVDYLIKFTIDALLVAGAKLGRPMGEVIPVDIMQRGGLPDLGLNVFVELLACGLLHADATMSAKRAKAMLDADPRCYYTATAAIITAWFEAQRELLPPDLFERFQHAMSKGSSSGEAQQPPSTDDASAAGPTSGATSGSADGSASTPS